MSGIEDSTNKREREPSKTRVRRAVIERQREKAPGRRFYYSPLLCIGGRVRTAVTCPCMHCVCGNVCGVWGTTAGEL